MRSAMMRLLKQLAGKCLSVLLFLRKRKLISAVLAAACLLLAIDYGIGKKQDAILQEKAAKKERLEKLANFMIFPDIHDAWDVKDDPEKYEVVIKVDNVADEVVFVTHPEVKAYVQTNFYWKEVPVRELEDTRKEQMYQLDPGQYLYRKLVDIDRSIEYAPYLVPLYMHVRFRISLFVLPESAFNEETGGERFEEVIERYTDVYIYLKPYFVTDEQILAKMTWNENKVPIQIPMPPH